MHHVKRPLLVAGHHHVVARGQQAEQLHVVVPGVHRVLRRGAPRREPVPVRHFLVEAGYAERRGKVGFGKCSMNEREREREINEVRGVKIEETATSDD